MVTIDALLAEGKQSEAEKEMETAQRLGNESQNRFLCLQFELASGRVLLQSEQPESASSLLLGVNRDSKRYGFVGLEFASDLALAELANKTKHGARAQIELHALQKSATSKGFGLIARKAFQEALVPGNQM